MKGASSFNIAEYPDDVFPDPPLQPEDPFVKYKMLEWSLLHTNQDRLQGYLAHVTSSVDTERLAAARTSGRIFISIRSRSFSSK